MTDKQIIIDGVPVQDCEFYPYLDDICREYGKCQNNPNCNYKQLQRELMLKKQADKDLKCMYCAEMGIINPNVFIEIVDEELGLGWICKECFLESEKEKDQHLKELEQQLIRKEQECEAYKMEAEEGYEINAELKAENEELRQILWNVDFNRQSKGKKLIRIEELLKKCATGYTDEFIQEMFSILYELEPVCRYNKLEQLSKTLTEIKEIAENVIKNVSDRCIETTPMYGVHKQILQKISECEV